MARIYRIDVIPDELADRLGVRPRPQRLVRARTRAQAERHVWKQMIESRVAAQDEMIELLDRGVAVEDAGE